ncbi:MAG: nitrilase-related carbon-nitrogen hydrolase, partial [Steroidobacteraceae bacterium]
AGAIARAAHPALKVFWSAGDLLQRGGRVEAPRLNPLRSPRVNVTLAAAPVSGNPAAIKSAIQAARSKDADLIAFPADAVHETEIDSIRAAARDSQITVVIGAAHREANGIFNSAFVIGPDGSVLTRYDQLSAEPPFLAGTAPAKMWFSVKGIPAIVTLERDALWTELSELAAIAGARIVVHLERAAESSFQARQTRLQVWSNLASFLTLTATVGDGDASLWDHLRGMEEISAEAKGRPRPDTGAAAVYSPWSANLIARASSPLELLVATRLIPAATNPHHPLQTTRYNPQMDAWYRLGATLVRGGYPQAP